MIRQIVLSLLSCLLSTALVQHSPSPRWAQAVALLDSTLYVHGGLSDPSNSYSYTSAPEISDLLVLDLSTSFSSSSPPWQLFANSSSPALAWHTLSAFSPTQLFLFGGQPGPNSVTVLTTLNDSSGLLLISSNPSPSFFMKPQNWANEPMRRIRHSSSFTSGKVWIIGGEQADGSGNAFSEHYFFSQSGPKFVQLPSSSSAPPDIYGHASLVLPDGRLLVLGGYCASCSKLVPMNMVWSLDTTQNPPAWEKLATSDQSLPSPRRDFAAVVLSNGQILIHGGGDALLQTTYSDGWILDTGQNPMVWNSVDVLTQLGKRKDHFAVQASGYVLFCFGYGTSSPAPASLFVYDPTTSSMVPSYDAPPPSSIPAITSLPVPTQTGSNPSSGGGTSTPPYGSSGFPPSTSGSSSSSNNRTIAIALGAIFGVVGLVAGGLVTMYYMKRVHNRDERTTERLLPLANDHELASENGSMSSTALGAGHLSNRTNEEARGISRLGVMKDILAYLRIDKSGRHPSQPRKDMFADEDTRSFGWTGYSGTVQKQSSESTSVWSLHSVSALVRGVISREPGGSGLDQGCRDREKSNHFSEGVKEGSIPHGSLGSEYSSHLTHQRDESFWSYTDPFEDPWPDDEYDSLNPRLDTPDEDAVYEHSIPNCDDIATTLGPSGLIWPFSLRSRMLTPLRETSRVSFSDPSNSLPSLQESANARKSMDHAEKAMLSPMTSISPTCYSPTASRFSDPFTVGSVPRHSLLSEPTLAHSASMSRRDSWWSRLTKPPLLDRRTSITSTKPLDFRDPTPAPPLDEVDETKKLSCVDGAPDDRPAEHGRSVSSAHSGRTANTDSAEHLGGRYDVVQRIPSDGSSLQRVSSLGFAGTTGVHDVKDHAPEMSLSSDPPHVDPPYAISSIGSDVVLTDREAPSKTLVPQSRTTSQKRGTMVTSRVRDYERKMSEELESQQIPQPRNSRRREEIPSRTRPTIQYGVAPRVSLFIANPDLGYVS